MSVDQQIIDDADTRAGLSVFVYEAPVRLWHWINALCILTLATTGYFIASPLPSVTGEASANFLMGYIRFAHFTAGYLFAVGLLGRIYWAFVGNHHARQLFYVPIFRKGYWAEVFFEIRWYLFLTNRPKKYVGHNPLAQLAMFFFITLGVVWMICTGFALYAEGAQAGSLPDKLFGWMHGLIWNSQTIHTLHHLGMWWIVIFMVVHIYVAVREDIMSRQSIVSTMISGYRTFKDDDPE